MVYAATGVLGKNCFTTTIVSPTELPDGCMDAASEYSGLVPDHGNHAVDSGQEVSHYSGQNCSGQVVAEWDLRRHQRLVSSPAVLLFGNPLFPAFVRW